MLIRLVGGLGNQMFIYAFAKTMSLKGYPILLNILFQQLAQMAIISWKALYYRRRNFLILQNALLLSPDKPHITIPLL